MPFGPAEKSRLALATRLYRGTRPKRVTRTEARDGLLYLASEEAGLYVYRFNGARKRLIN